MPDINDMPPDPFDEDGIDPFAVEAAEKLARDDAPGFDPRWDNIGGEPTLDDFDDAARELNACDDPENPNRRGMRDRSLHGPEALALGHRGSRCDRHGAHVRVSLASTPPGVSHRRPCAILRRLSIVAYPDTESDDSPASHSVRGGFINER